MIGFEWLTKQSLLLLYSWFLEVGCLVPTKGTADPDLVRSAQKKYPILVREIRGTGRWGKFITTVCKLSERGGAKWTVSWDPEWSCKVDGWTLWHGCQYLETSMTYICIGTFIYKKGSDK